MGAYYFRALDWSIATNDAWLVRSIGLASCSACRRVSRGIAELRRLDETELDGRIRVRSAVVDLADYELRYDVAVRVIYDEEAVRLRTSDGRVQTTQPSVTHAFGHVFLKWRAGGWRVVEVTNQ